MATHLHILLPTKQKTYYTPPPTIKGMLELKRKEKMLCCLKCTLYSYNFMLVKKEPFTTFLMLLLVLYEKCCLLPRNCCCTLQVRMYVCMLAVDVVFQKLLLYPFPLCVWLLLLCFVFFFFFCFPRQTLHICRFTN